jgi:hypothetical protein
MNSQTVTCKKGPDLTDNESAAYQQKVYKLLDGMKPGDKLQIEKITKVDTRDKFIEVIKQYMDEHEWQAGLSFGKAFTELRKYDLTFIMQNTKSKNVTL